MNARLTLVVRIVEQKSPIRFPPRKSFDVFLVRPPKGVTGEDILALPGIPKKGEEHGGTNPPCYVTKRGAVRIGPARWAVWVHYSDPNPEVIERETSTIQDDRSDYGILG